MKAFFPLYLASVKEFLRDRMALFWTLAFPLLFIVLFGIIFSGSGNTTFTVGLAVQDKGPVGSAMGKAFESVNAFAVTEGTQSDLLARFKNGDLQVVVVVPDGVSSSASAGKASQVEVY